MRRKLAGVTLFALLLLAICLERLGMLPHFVFTLGLKPNIVTSRAERGFSKPGDKAVVDPQTKDDRHLPTGAISLPGVSTQTSPDRGPDKKPETRINTTRIAPDGPSVFAGQAPPFSRLELLDRGTTVATATANENGDWATVTDYKFADLKPDVKVKLLEPDVSIPNSNEPHKELPAVPPPPEKAITADLEALVAKAREQAKSSQSVRTSETHEHGSDSDLKAPIPITFVYDEDTLTGEGRHSTDLLLEYLRLKRVRSVTLSGHADERGLPMFNLELSEKRLKAIQRILRQGGYAGKLTLLPKGSSEPFAGVDRKHYPYEQLMQLDRRVELRAAE